MIRAASGRCIASATAAVLSLGVGLILGAERTYVADSHWLSGEALQEALAHKVGIAWSNLPLRGALKSLSTAQQLAVLLDRRIDPDQKIELVCDDIPLREGLARIASRMQIGVTMVGPVAYFGPNQTAQRLRTVATLRNDDAARVPPSSRPVWMQAKPLKWDKLSAPRELVTALARENGLRITGLEQIPADLWGAADMPALPLAERLTLLLAQFDLTFEIAADGTSLRLVPMPANPFVERRYPISGAPADIIGQLRQNKLLTGAATEVVGGKLIVRGRQEDQDVVSDLLAGRTARRSSVVEGRKVYTLRVELPINKLLDALQRQMGLEIEVDNSAIKAAGISMETEIQVNVKDVSADDLLKAVLDPAGLTFARHDNIVEIKPK